MTKINDGGPAFPTYAVATTSFNGTPTVDTHPGLTLRDWFAGMAMQGLLAADARLPVDTRDEQVEAFIAIAAYQIADAMIAERERGK